MPNKFEVDGDNEKVFKVIKPAKKKDKKEKPTPYQKAASDKDKDGSAKRY